jgi:hypothetical protein
MNTNKNKDINELLGRFYPADEAAKAARDIRSGDELLSKNPAPLPRPALLADIKTQMLLAYHRRQRTHQRRYIYGSMGMAASLAVVCGMAWLYIAGIGVGNASQASLGNPTFYTAATEEIASITTQLDQIEDSAIAIKATDSEPSSPAEFQTDIANLESSIWKG